jgi:drug/metabolite transporter superfamily protein YnfA
LRVSSCAPGQAEVVFGGAAAWRWLRQGAGLLYVDTSSIRSSPFVAFRNRSPDPAGRIWRGLVSIFIAAQLWWQELRQAVDLMPAISNNKAETSSSVPASGRDARRLLMGISAGLPWRKTKVDHLQASSFNKRLRLHIDDNHPLLLLLAYRGGEGKEERSWMSVPAGRSSGNLCLARQDSVLDAAINQWWLRFAIAISGHGIGLAVLEQDSSSFFFLRVGRISCGVGAAIIVSADPSGCVPGVCRDGRARRRSIGGVRELDRVSAVVARVLCVKFLDLIVCSFFCKVLVVKLYPPPGK